MAATRPTAADHEEGDWREKPDDVEIVFDQAWLEQYEPRFIAERETRDKFVDLYAYAVRGTGYSHDVACYWCQLTHQDGLEWFGIHSPDSHLGDHEPVYVYVDPDSGEVDVVVYSTWHHYPSEVTPATGQFVRDRHPDHETHVVLRIVPEWHNFSADVGDRTGAYLPRELGNWVAVRDSWMDNDFYARTADEAIEDPATMRQRKAWWADDTRDHRFGRLYYRVGFSGAEQSDDLR